jgi:hypothetical protein
MVMLMVTVAATAAGVWVTGGGSDSSSIGDVMYGSSNGDNGQSCSDNGHVVTMTASSSSMVMITSQNCL